jgi:DNA polymerase III delta prime subunit
MPIAFNKAARTNSQALFALAGPSGSGKTMSALRLARGLAGPDGRIAVIDTEHRRALHYADEFAFDHAAIEPPFTPERFTEAIAQAEKAGYAVIVVDSASDEYEGTGGVLDIAEQLAPKIKSPGNWAEPKARHKKMMNKLRQTNAHLIFCLRAEDKIEIIKDPATGKNVVKKIGWQPICEKRFMYDMTVSMLFDPAAPGIPIPIKMYRKFLPLFPAGNHVTEAAGAAIAAWARGGTLIEKKPREPASYEDLAIAGRAAAAHGIQALRQWFATLLHEERAAIKPLVDTALKKEAADADAAAEADAQMEQAT